MGMPQLVVTAVLVEGRSRSEVAREYGVSRRWVQVLVARFLAEGEAGLAPRSRRPHHSPRRTSPEVEDLIVALRKELDRGGHEAGAATIAFHLAQRHGQAPAVSTIWRILSARGFVAPQPHKRPKSSFVRFEAAQPNERWQTDITHWRLAGGREVEILNILDDHSRLCLLSRALTVFKADDVTATVLEAAARHGDPASMLSDNGAVFTGIPRGGGRVSLELALAARGIPFRHSRPYHPQTCGKVERFHQTLKKWLRHQPRGPIGARAADPARHLPRLLQRRPTAPSPAPAHPDHRVRGPPESSPHRPAHRPRALPGPPRQDRPLRSHHPAPQHRLHHIGIGRRHAGTRVLVLTHDLHIRVLTQHGELLRELTLNPARDYQPQAKP